MPDVLLPVNHEESYWGKTKCIPTKSTSKTHSLITIHFNTCIFHHRGLKKFGDNEVD